MKYIFTCLLVLCAFYEVKAQSTNYYNRMNHIFGAIDKSKVTTGYLKEFGVRLNRVESFNGLMDTTNWVDLTQWRSLYSSLHSMRVGTVASSMTDPSTVFSDLETQQAANPGVILLAAQYYAYQQYKTTAYTSGDVTIVNERIFDVAGRNPYETKTAFAVTPVEYHLEGNSFSFKLQSNMVYTNSGLTLSIVEIDFSNGQGYQVVSLNTVKNVSYASGGVKELKIKFVYNGGTTLHSHSKLYVDYIPSEAQVRFSGSGAYTVPVTGAAFLGETATGYVTIETAGTDGVLNKPLIVVEGFDPDDSFNYYDFIINSDPNAVDVGSIDVFINSTKTLNQAIEDEGYDLVFINYGNGKDYIQRNAYMVEEVIKWVNDHKVGNEKNVVLGMSMGGIVARYALRHMEITSRVHETKLYISHDTPHQGANVPLAYQAFVRHLAGESIGWPAFLSIFTIDVKDLDKKFPELKEGLTLLQSPAAKQMLVYQLSGTGSGISVNTNSLFSSFTTEYRNLGYPVQDGIRNIAISNGSECGTPLDFGPYATLADINKTVDLSYFASALLGFFNAYSLNPIKTLTSYLSTDTDVKAEFNMKALPSQQAKQIYKGRIYIKKKVLWLINVEEPLINTKTLNSTSSMLAMDNAGGGIYDINQFVSLSASFSEFIKEQRFSFIPTYSSLDIGVGAQPIATNDLTRSYSPVFPPAAPKNTPFHSFFSNPVISENHTQFTLNNGNWLLHELQDTPQLFSCSYQCADPSISPAIIGSNLLCSGNNMPYTVSNITPGNTFLWSNSANLTYVAGQNTNSYTVTNQNPLASEYGGLTLSITGECQSRIISKQVWLGKPQPNGDISYELMTGVPSTICASPGSNAQFWAYTNPFNTEYFEWETNAGNFTEANPSYLFNPNHTTWNSMYFQVWEGNYPNSYIQVRSINQCGTSSWTTRNFDLTISSNCQGGGGMGLSMYPNPSSNYLDVTLEGIDPAIEQLDFEYRIEVIDGMGENRMNVKTNKRSTRLAVHDLPKGFYSVKAYLKDNVIERKIFIQ